MTLAGVVNTNGYTYADFNAVANNTLVLSGVISGTAFYTDQSSTGGVLINGTIDTTSSSGTLTATTGTVIFSGANTYTTPTTIGGGTFLANNTTGSATGTNTVTVNSGAILGGKGIITGAVTANSGATIFPGANQTTVAEKLTLSGGLTAFSGSILNFNLNGTGGNLGNDELLLGGAGASSFNGALTINLYNLGQNTISTGTSYTLISATGLGSGSGSPTLTIDEYNGLVLDTSYGSGLGYIFNASTDSFTVQFSAIPEPQPWGLTLCGLGLIGLALRFRHLRA